jgi:4-azaleucine resistance transporter AzlC
MCPKKGMRRAARFGAVREGQEIMKRKALRAAFPHTLPVLTGYAFLGLAYGILMQSAGFPFWYPALISLVVYAGSMQYAAVPLLGAAFDPAGAFFLTLMVNARHLFYGVSMLEPYRAAGKKTPYLVFAMSDETFSVNVSACPPEGVERGWFMFWVSLLDQFYWVAASALGGLLGRGAHCQYKGH